MDRRKNRWVSSYANLVARVDPEDIPVGLTADEYQAVIEGPFDSVSLSSAYVYEGHISYFEPWCLARNIAVRDVRTHQLKLYIAEMHEGLGLSLSWVRCTVAAVKRVLHWERRLAQVDWAEVARKIRGYQRLHPYVSAGVDGITRELFEVIELCAFLPAPGEWAEKTARRAAFDLALLSVMRDCMLRRSEAAALRWGDIGVNREPGKVHGVLQIPFSKTDQNGKGEVGYLSLESLAYLQDMAVLNGRDPLNKKELVFGICAKQVANRIAAACRHAGLSGHFSGHSCRVGMAMDLTMNNICLAAIMQAGRWRVPDTVIRYIRLIAVGDGPVAKVHRAWNRERASVPRLVA